MMVMVIRGRGGAGMMMKRGIGMVQRRIRMKKMCAGAAATPTTTASGVGVGSSEWPQAGKLHLVATPIGNVKDMSPRAVEVLVGVDILLAEDTRRARRLLAALGARTEGRLRTYHEHSPASETQEIAERLANGASAALISDAGTPLLSDPGAALVRACDGHVIPVPGCSAAVTALICSGLPACPHTFLGFLPDTSSSRRRRLELFASTGATLLMFVPPHDLRNVLEDAAAVLGNDRRCCIAREMTKEHEEFYRDSLVGALREMDHGADAPSFSTEKKKDRQRHGNNTRFRGEIVLVVDGASEREMEDELTPTRAELKAHIKRLMSNSESRNDFVDNEHEGNATKVSVRHVVDHVVKELGVRKKLVYKLALEVQLARELELEKQKQDQDAP